MKKANALLFFLLILLLCGLAGASYWFKVIEVSPVSVAPNSDANFTVTVKGLGSDGAYVGLTFRNLSDGLTIVDRDRLRYIFPTGTTAFNVTIRAADLTPGTYSLEVGTAATGSPPGFTKVNVTVSSPLETAAPEAAAYRTAEPVVVGKSATEEVPEETSEETAGPETESAPAPGIALALLALLLAGRKML
ncbi:MAG: hypothetical protein HPY61_03350 [Methanotrichaceae archaeon]|nr:hypothetical protein [Methanotrichaceae archaeon]